MSHRVNLSEMESRPQLPRPRPRRPRPRAWNPTPRTWNPRPRTQSVSHEDAAGQGRALSVI